MYSRRRIKTYERLERLSKAPHVKIPEYLKTIRDHAKIGDYQRVPMVNRPLLNLLKRLRVNRTNVASTPVTVSSF
jgi:hypothetical protein